MTEDFLTQAFISLKSKMISFRSSSAIASEDALQDAFCRLWERKYRVGSVKEAEALLSRTGRNITIDEFRKSKRRPVESLEGRQVAASENDAQEKELLFRKVEASISEELTEVQKRIVRRHEYDGVTFEQIAMEMGMQPAAVRMQISRARKVLRDKFRNEDEQD